MNTLLKSFIKLFCCILIAAFIPSCSSEKSYLRQEYENSPVIAIQYWGENWKHKPLRERLAPAPVELITRIRIENELYGFSEKPVAAQPSPEFFAALNIIESGLPEPVRLLVTERLIGIFIVDNLGTSGYTEAIRDEYEKEAYAIIVLDKGVLLSRTANAWATWKENSVFKPQADGRTTLQLNIEQEKNDTIVNAIRFILLHEFGHVLGMASHAHPTWDDSKPALPIEMPFPKLSWKMNKDGTIISRFDDLFPERKSVRFYVFEKANLSNDQIITTYKNLAQHTNFPSLQAAATQWEDFAESFATYFHVVLEKRPWQVVIKSNGQPPVIIDSCWHENRCAAKGSFMGKWFADPTGIKK